VVMDEPSREDEEVGWIDGWRCDVHIVFSLHSWDGMGFALTSTRRDNLICIYYSILL
jgi:hypothetical protein